jgi:hypothetical protein
MPTAVMQHLERRAVEIAEAGVGKDPLGMTILDDPPLMHEEHATTGGRNHLQLVAHEQDGDTPLAMQAINQPHHALASPEIEIRRRFIEQEQARLARHGPSQQNTALLTTGECRVRLVRQMAYSQFCQPPLNRQSILRTQPSAQPTHAAPANGGDFTDREG